MHDRRLPRQAWEVCKQPKKTCKSKFLASGWMLDIKMWFAKWNMVSYLDRDEVDWKDVEKSFKVFLAVDLNIAAERVMHDNRGKEEQYTTLEEAKEKLFERAQTENLRYKDIYNLEYFNYK